MNRKIRIAAATAVVGALTALPAAMPAGAQEALDFSVDGPLEGQPGDLVNGHVTPESVAASCNNDAGELQNRFAATAEAVVGLDDVFIPGGFDPNNLPDDFAVDNFEQLSWLATTLVTDQVGRDLALAEEALPQTFVITFADIATQEPVGEQANYDPAVGDATVTVPDVEPGPWAVAAACVSPSADPALLEGAVRVNAPLVEAFATSEAFEAAAGFPFPEFPITDPSLFFGIGIETAQGVRDALVPALVTPDALGAQIFCVLDDAGACPGSGPGPGPGPGGPGAPTAPPATPVTGRQPTFTG